MARVFPKSTTLILANNNTVQLILNFTQTCGYTSVPAHLSHVKLKNLACIYIHTVAHNFGMSMPAVNTSDTSDARYQLALRLPHYTSGIQVQ